MLTDGDLWHEQRRFVLRHLREFGFGRRTMVELVETESEQLVANFKKALAGCESTGKVMDVADEFGVNVLNTLWMMMASIRYSSEDKELKKLQNLLTELFATIDMNGALFSQFPLLIHLAPKLSGYKEFLSIHQRLWAFLKVINYFVHNRIYFLYFGLTNNIKLYIQGTKQ